MNAAELSFVEYVGKEVDAGKPSNLRSMNLNGASLAKRFGIEFPLNDEVMAGLAETLTSRGFAATQDVIGLIVRAV